MAITPLLVIAAPSPLDHERTASIHCAATRENTECATRASRATANVDGHHATARRHRKPGEAQHWCQLLVLAARATANTDGHHAAAPGGRDTGTQDEERAAFASLRRARAEDESSPHTLGGRTLG